MNVASCLPCNIHVAALFKERARVTPSALLRNDGRQPPKNFRSRLKYLGPGLIISGAIVGSGELIATTALGAKVGFVALWLILFLDDDRHPDAKLGNHDGGRTVAPLYDLITAENKTVKPIGEWNEARIISHEQHVEPWLNGAKVSGTYSFAIINYATELLPKSQASPHLHKSCLLLKIKWIHY